MEKSFFDLNTVLENDSSCKALVEAFKDLHNIPAIRDSFNSIEHVQNTPIRAVKALLEMFSGCWEDPKLMLSTSFAEKTYDELIYVNNIPFVSSCAHHHLPFFGRAHFAYIPNGRIVGLSKIPRLVGIFSRRPQVQEQLTQQIVDTFMDVIQPYGCGIVMEAYHLCMVIRGVKSDGYTKTNALRGWLKEKSSIKDEFLRGVHQTSGQIWP